MVDASGQIEHAENLILVEHPNIAGEKSAASLQNFHTPKMQWWNGNTQNIDIDAQAKLGTIRSLWSLFIVTDLPMDNTVNI